MRRIGHAGLALAALGLAGCSAYDGWKYRAGPGAELQADDISAAVDEQLKVMAQFRRAVIGATDRNVAYGSSTWWQVALAGYNYVDSRCEAYLHELVMLELTRDRSNTAFDRLDKATSAITAISGSSGLAIAVLAQSFGFAKEMFNVTLNGYLYNTKASVVAAKVHDLMATYKAEVRANKEVLVSEQDVYSSIRGYLNLCLPATIESKLTEAVTGSAAKTTTPGSPPSAGEETPPASPTPQVKLSSQ